MLLWARPAGLGLGVLAAIAVLQFLALTTPADLISERASTGGDASSFYRLRSEERPGPDPLRLTLYGDASRVPSRDIVLVPVNASGVDPLARPLRPGTRPQAGRIVVIFPRAPRGTYKLKLPGFRAFGLFVVSG